MADLKLIHASKLYDHPDNPRIVFRDDVIDAIVANLGSDWPKKHALHVRPIDGGYQILAGHTRRRAADKKGIAKVWVWIDDLPDDEAYMELVTSNAQGELSPLEIGLHCLRCEELGKGGRGKKGGLSAYAKRIGKAKSTVSEHRNAAEVLENCSVDRTVFLNKAQHLSTIHALPKACWPACVEWLATNDVAVPKIQERVKLAKAFLKDYGISDAWAKTYLEKHRCAGAVFCGTRPGLFATLSTLATQVRDDLAQHEELSSQWLQWLVENSGGDSWDIAKTQTKRVELDTLRLEREEAPALETVSVLLADPPWQYDFAETTNRKVENQYPTATVDEICEHINAPWVPVLSEDAVLFLWATAPKLREALKVMEAWGFEYKTHAVWDKQKIGMGYWFRGQHELLLVGTRGSMSPPEQAKRVASVFSESRQGHSQKPTCVYDAVAAMFSEDKRFEMYQRKTRKGWAGGGLEA